MTDTSVLDLIKKGNEEIRKMEVTSLLELIPRMEQAAKDWAAACEKVTQEMQALGQLIKQDLEARGENNE